MKRHHRWEAVLLACLLVAAGICVSHGKVQQASAASEVISVPVAMYHSVTDEGKSPGQYVISPSMLESDLKYLAERGYQTVTVTDLVAYVKEGTALPEKPVMLTFDDGYYNNYCNAYPLLKQYGMRAVLSPVGTLTEQFSESDDTGHEVWSYCTGIQLKEMSDSGVMEMQNHSFDFHSLSPRRGCLRKSGEDEASYRETFISDTQRAQEMFAALDIPEPVCYTYPYGACNDETDALVKECGFVATLSCEEGVAHITRDPACLTGIRRCNRDGRVTSEQFWSSLLAQAEKGD
ncbi:polysaccharide deacetylase family protein [Butyricicoccus sp.]|uniref:polysaccharide deacetylase family protein n=1 Tax=Butyricicoccus sp. TaxID=2049021 RepID=UPI003F1774D0